MSEAISLSSVLQFLVCAGILWIGRTGIRNSEALVRLETLLRGSDGSNGLSGDVRLLKRAHEKLLEDFGRIRSDLDLLCQRVEQIEKGAA